MGSASERVFKADPTALLRTIVCRARDVGYRAGLEEDRRSVL